MRYLTVQRVAYHGPAVAERLDPLMEALLGLEAADDAIDAPDLAVNLSTGLVDVQMVVEAEDPAQAMVKALATLRAAIHAIGGATPGWRTDESIMQVAPEEDADRLAAFA